MNNLIKSLIVSLAVFSTSCALAVDEDLPDALKDILLNTAPIEANESFFSDMQQEQIERFKEKPKLEADAPYEARISLKKLGFNDGVMITAGMKETGFRFTLPTDKIITDAKVELIISMTEKMVERHPHISIAINGQKLGSIVLSNVEETSYELNVPSEYLSQENIVSFEIEDDEEFACTIDYTGDYNIKFGPQSSITVNGNTLELGSDLTLFPLPFIDEYDIFKPTVNFALPQLPSKSVLKGAMLLASYFGIKSDYRSVQFNVSIDSLPQGNAILFGKPEEKVCGITMPKKEGVYIKSNPYYKPYKLVYVVAHDDRTFVDAVYQLIDPMYDDNDRVIDVTYMPIATRRHAVSEAYDAPRWIPINRKVYLKELLQKNQSLTAKGFFHNNTDISFRAAPDLYQLYDGQGELGVFYEFPTEKDLDEISSGLNVTLSGEFIRKLSVNKKGLLENLWRISGGDGRENQRILGIDPKSIYGYNNLSFYFDLRLNPKASCTLLHDENIRSVIDSKSYIDLTKSVHFARMPNLSFFAGASFPFSRYKDFSKTAVILPQEPSDNEYKTLFDMVARAGNATGGYVYNEDIYFGSSDYETNADDLEDKNLLIVSTLSNKDFLTPLLKGSAFEFNNYELNVYDYGIFSTRGGVLNGLSRLMSADFRSENQDANRFLKTSFSWRGFLSFISPYDDKKIAVLVTATNDKEIAKLSDDLDKPEINAKIGGDISVITGEDKVSKFTVGDFIYTGDVSLVFEIMHFAGEHILWLAFASFIVIMIFSFVISLILRARARRRLNLY